MKNLKTKAFTLVELLVVITILAILSVVAFQSFGWATDKAENVTKKSNISTLGNTLQLFKTEERYYPMPQNYDASTNIWGYNSWTTATISNTITVTYNDQEISSINSGNWGWTINWIWGNISNQIAAKWVIWTNGSFNKKYLKKEIYDTQLGDIKLTWVADDKMIKHWVWKYTYAVYARPAISANWNVSWSKWTYYELAATFTNTQWEWYITYLVWDYTSDNFNTPSDYPETLIWLKDEQKDLNVATTVTNQGIPYPIDWFAK